MASIGLDRTGIAGRLEVVPLANAATAVALVAYVICAALNVLTPDAVAWLFQSWSHGLSLDPLRAAGPAFQPVPFVAGLVTFGGTVWLATAAVARLYNAWTHGEAARVDLL